MSLSLIGNHLRRLFPALKMTEFGLPKKGGLARLAKLLQADGYLELDTSLTANKEHMIRKTEKWPVLTEADVPPAGFEEVFCLIEAGRTSVAKIWGDRSLLVILEEITG